VCVCVYNLFRRYNIIVYYIAHDAPVAAVVATAVTESLLGATEGVSCRIRGRNDEITNIGIAASDPLYINTHKYTHGRNIKGIKEHIQK